MSNPLLLVAFLNLLSAFCLSDSKGIKTNKNKKKNRRRKDQLKDSSTNNLNGNHKVWYILSFSLFLSILSCVCVPCLLHRMFHDAYLFVFNNHHAAIVIIVISPFLCWYWHRKARSAIFLLLICCLSFCSFRSSTLSIQLSIMAGLMILRCPLPIRLQNCNVLLLLPVHQRWNLMMVKLMMI